MKRHSWRLLSLAAATTTVITVMGAASAAASQTSPAPSPSPTSPAPGPVFTGRLYGVTATSAGNAWAVGLHPDSSLIIHWDGSTWTQQLAGPGYFWSVGASSAGNAWAVGGTDWFTSQTMTYHWGGTAWTHIPSPTPAATALLRGVTVSGNEAWAVGATGASPGNPDLSHASPLIEHWDGTAWKVMRTPPLSQAGLLQSVTALSSHNIWAVGWIGSGQSGSDSSRPLIEHWKGRSWFRVKSPAVAPQGLLTSVTATGYRHVWAVGATSTFGATKTLTERWNGSTWSVVPSPTPDYGAQLNNVSATSPGDAWAVGQTTYNGACPPTKCQTVIEHWDGKNWQPVKPSPSTNPPSTYLNSLWGVSAITRDDAWAVGTTDYATTLILHWDGKTWKPSPPARFEPVSASFLSATRGFALGGAGCAGGNACRAQLAATTDGGAHWRFLNTPDVLLYSSTVSSFRQAWRVGGVVFASARTGWLYGPGLYATHDGGGHWRRIVLRGDIVPSLGGGVTAMAASSGIAYAVVSPDPFHGKRDELYKSPAGRDGWARVGRITAAQATFAVSGRSAWFATGGGFTVRATHLWATTDGVHWRQYPFRCPGNYGLTSIAAASTSRLAFLCTGESSSAHTLKEVLVSSDGGKTEHLTGRPPSAGSGGVIAVPPRRANVIVLADSFFLYRSADGGKTWKQVWFETGGAIWRSLSFVTPTVGCVVLASRGQLLRTTDTGRTWHRVPF